jgi:hypothetical protein
MFTDHMLIGDRLQYREQKRIKKMYIEGQMEATLALAQAKIDCIAEAAIEYQKSCVDLQKEGRCFTWQKFIL